MKLKLRRIKACTEIPIVVYFIDTNFAWFFEQALKICGTYHGEPQILLPRFPKSWEPTINILQTNKKQTNIQKHAKQQEIRTNKQIEKETHKQAAEADKERER